MPDAESTTDMADQEVMAGQPDPSHQKSRSLNRTHVIGNAGELVMMGGQK
ncbi:MAG: hypothetical protein V2I43_05005 [Parvularcula sp.]|jgi:hypothetical protein|nr:hypothetical protein [Parvularcula sp.]